MLSDPLPIKPIDTAQSTAISVASTDSFATIDVSPGRTVRKSTLNGSLAGVVATLTIAHTSSNENKPKASDRHLVRIDFDGLNSAVDGSGQALRASVHLVMMAPRGAYLPGGEAYDAPNQARALEVLLGVLLTSGTANTLDNRAKLLRIIAGEP